MSFLIDHPASWIGIPERFPYPAPGGPLQNAEQWATDVLTELVGSTRVPQERVDAAREVLLMVESTRREREATRSFVALVSWDGPVYVADAVAEPAEVLGGMNLAEYAGADDPRQLTPAVLSRFVCDTGLEGVRCVRALPYDDGAEIVLDQVDYAWVAGDQVLRITAAQLDHGLFESMLTFTDALARSVRPAETPLRAALDLDPQSDRQ